MESHLHYVLASMGLDDLELQADLHDRSGAWIGRFDQVDRARLRILEYDGEQHRTDRQQYLHDQTRLDWARDLNYRVLRVHAEDFRPSRLHETKRRLCTFLGRAPRPLRAGLARRFTEI